MAVRVAAGGATDVDVRTLDVRPAHLKRRTDVQARARPAVNRPVAHAAGDPGVMIADFNFTPGTATVRVGDSITWTNNGPSTHTATAQDGSFDTGILQKRASGSHTFTHPGTFSYYCKIHPFMHGTIIVLAGASSSTAGPSSTAVSGQSSTAAPSTAAPTAQSPPGGAQTLPMTGMDLITGLFAGVLLIELGVTLRRALAR